MIYFRFDQNNSGAFFDECAGHVVLVEADTEEDAYERLYGFGVSIHSCDCCGPRWPSPRREEGRLNSEALRHMATDGRTIRVLFADYSTDFYEDGRCTRSAPPRDMPADPFEVPA